MKKRIMFIGITFILIFLGSCDLINQTSNKRNLTFRVIPDYVEKVNGVYPAEMEYPAKSIVTITPAINGKNLFASDVNGFFDINDVPFGSYSIHHLFTDPSLDKILDFTSDSSYISDPILYPTDQGLYYYIFNLTETGNPALTKDIRTGISKNLSRDSLLSSVNLENKSAYNLIPPGYAFDGLDGVKSLIEDTDWVNLDLIGSTSDDMRIQFYRMESDYHLNIAKSIKDQLQGTPAMGNVKLDELSWTSYLDNKKNHSYQVSTSNWIMDSNDMLEYFNYIVSVSGFSDSRFTTLESTAEAALTSGDLTLYLDSIEEIHNLLLNDIVLIPIFY